MSREYRLVPNKRHNDDNEGAMIALYLDRASIDKCTLCGTLVGEDMASIIRTWHDYEPTDKDEATVWRLEGRKRLDRQGGR